MNISVVSVIHTHSVFTHVRKLVGTHTPVWFSHLSERLFFNRKKKVWVRDAAVCRGGAVSLCASSWAFSSRSKAAAVCLALRWPVGVGTQNWGILTLRASACVCVPVFMCVYVCDACVECVLSWAVGFLGLPELLHTPLWLRGRGTISNSPLLLSLSGAESGWSSRAVKEPLIKLPAASSSRITATLISLKLSRLLF